MFLNKPNYKTKQEKKPNHKILKQVYLYNISVRLGFVLKWNEEIKN